MTNTVSINKKALDGLEWTEVESSQIEKVAWLSDDDSREIGLGDAVTHLLVAFRNGGVYAYANAPVERLTDLVEAESAGRVLHASVKGVYPYIKLDVVEDATD